MTRSSNILCNDTINEFAFQIGIRNVFSEIYRSIVSILIIFPATIVTDSNQFRPLGYMIDLQLPIFTRLIDLRTCAKIMPIFPRCIIATSLSITHRAVNQQKIIFFFNKPNTVYMLYRQLNQKQRHVPVDGRFVELYISSSN